MSKVQSITSETINSAGKFIKINLKDGITDEMSGEDAALCLEYNSKGEAYFNKSSVFSFNIDEETSTISIIFNLTMADLSYRSVLKFPKKDGEFQRVKRELTE